MKDLTLDAQTNLHNRLRANPYPGRGIIIGTDDERRNMVQVYWIMGRSEGSRNRYFREEEGSVFVEAIDLSKVKDPELTLYQAMAQMNGWYVVTNGKQTVPVLEALMQRTGTSECEKLLAGLKEFQYEPDKPNFTPRISGICCPFNDPAIVLSSLQKSPDSDKCMRPFFPAPGTPPGFGLCITTYAGDGNPLPSFREDPFFVPLDGDIDAIAEAYWNTLNADNKVSLAVKFIPLSLGPSTVKIINKYSKP